MKQVLAIVVLFTAAVASAEDQGVRSSIWPAQGETRLIMPTAPDFGIMAWTLPSRVRVPLRERIVLSLPPEVQPSGPVQWYRNNSPIEGATTRDWLIPVASASDSGFYQVEGLPAPQRSVGIHLDVTIEGHVANVSSRVQLPAGRGAQIMGFVVNGTRPKPLLFRVVGPSLSPFGLTGLATEPRIAAYNAKGERMAFVHPAVVIDWPSTFAAIGAFPLTGPEQPGFAWDWGSFPPGAYTLHAHDESGQGGLALIEVYELTVAPIAAGSTTP
jgi:hypothetical protein